MLRKAHILPPRKRRLVILDKLSGTLMPGRLTLLLGPPSSGKPILLKALCGALQNSDLKVMCEPHARTYMSKNICCRFDINLQNAIERKPSIPLMAGLQEGVHNFRASPLIALLLTSISGHGSWLSVEAGCKCSLSYLYHFHTSPSSWHAMECACKRRLCLLREVTNL